MLFNVLQPLLLLTLFKRCPRPPTHLPLHFVCPSGRATGKIAFLGAVASEHLGLVLLATVEDRARVWRWRRPLAFLAHGSTA